MIGRQIETADRVSSSLPLPTKNEAGVYSIEASGPGKEMYGLMEEITDLRSKLKYGEENHPNQIAIVDDLSQKSAELAVKIGRSFDLLPHTSDKTLIDESDFKYHQDYHNGDVLINAYGDVAISLRPGFGKQDDGSFFVEYALIKQGERTALKAHTDLKIEENGSISFLARRDVDRTGRISGGHMDGILSIEDGRVVAKANSVPEKGVFTSGLATFDQPSQHQSAIPYEIKIDPSLGSISDLPEGDRLKNFRILDDLKGKKINFAKVIGYMRSDKFNGEPEIKDHEHTVRQFLEEPNSK